jgi:DNA polymerase-4
MRGLGLAAKTIQISLRTNDLLWREFQTMLPYPSIISSEFTQTAMKLMREHFNWHKPLRSIGIRGTNLVSIQSERQLPLFDNNAQMRERAEKMEYVIDDIRKRFGHNSISRGLLMSDKALTHLNMQDGVVVNPFGRN